MSARILKVRSHNKLIQSANLIRQRMEDMQTQLYVMANELKQVKGENVSQEMDPSSASDYRVQFFYGCP